MDQTSQAKDPKKPHHSQQRDDALRGWGRCGRTGDERGSVQGVLFWFMLLYVYCISLWFLLVVWTSKENTANGIDNVVWF